MSELTHPLETSLLWGPLADQDRASRRQMLHVAVLPRRAQTEELAIIRQRAQRCQEQGLHFRVAGATPVEHPGWRAEEVER